MAIGNCCNFSVTVVFPFLSPVLRFVSKVLLRAGATEETKAAQFLIDTAEEVIRLRKQTGASQVPNCENQVDAMTLKFIYSVAAVIFVT